MNAPNITIRRTSTRGLTDIGWLKSQHSFSFGDYHEPAHMGFKTLRVINEDRVAPRGGFPLHPHRDMEIFSYVLSGALQHTDSLGHDRVLRPGQVQLMSAGRGIRHSEFNPSETEPVHFLQIWIQPAQAGLNPGYTEWMPAPAASSAKTLVISPDGRGASAVIQQDALVWHLKPGAGEIVHHELTAGRGLWLQVMRGTLLLNSEQLHAGDGASSLSAGTFTITASDASAEALLFDVA